MTFSSVISAETPRTVNEKAVSSIINPETSALIAMYWQKLSDTKDNGKNSNENKQVNIQSFLEECADIAKGEEKDFNADHWRKLTTYLLMAGDAHVTADKDVDENPSDNPKAVSCYLSAITAMKKIPEEKSAQTEWLVLRAWQNQRNTKIHLTPLSEPSCSDWLVLAICYMRCIACCKTKKGEEFTKFLSLAITTLENHKNQSTISSKRLLAGCYQLTADSYYIQAKKLEELVFHEKSIKLLQDIVDHGEFIPHDLYALSTSHQVLSGYYAEENYRQQVANCLRGVEYLENKMDSKHHDTKYWQELALQYREAADVYKFTQPATAKNYSQKVLAALKKIPDSEGTAVIWNWTATALAHIQGPNPHHADKNWHADVLNLQFRAIAWLNNPEHKHEAHEVPKQLNTLNHNIGLTYISSKNYSEAATYFQLVDSSTREITTRQSHQGTWKNLINNKEQLCGALFNAGSYQDAIRNCNQLFDYIDEAGTSNFPITSNAFKNFLKFGFDVLIAYVQDPNNKKLKGIEKNIFEAECQQLITRLLSYLHPQVKKRVITSSELSPIINILDKKTDATFEELKIVLRREGHPIPHHPLHIRESSTFIGNALNTLPVKGYLQAETWINNRSLRILMLQKTALKGNTSIVNALPTNAIWLNILGMLGGFSPSDAAMFHTNMRFFAHKKLLLLEAGAKIPSTTAQIFMSKLPKKINPYCLVTEAKELNHDIQQANNKEAVLGVLKKHIENRTLKMRNDTNATDTHIQNDPYIKMLTRHTQRMG